MARQRPEILLGRFLPTLVAASDLTRSLGRRISWSQRTCIQKCLRSVLFGLLKTIPSDSQQSLRIELMPAFENLEIVPQAESMMRFVDRQARKKADLVAKEKLKQNASSSAMDSTGKRAQTEQLETERDSKSAKLELTSAAVDEAEDEEEEAIRNQVGNASNAMIRHVFPDYSQAEAIATRLFTERPMMQVVEMVMVTLLTMPPVPPAIIAKQVREQEAARANLRSAGAGFDGDNEEQKKAVGTEAVSDDELQSQARNESGMRSGRELEDEDDTQGGKEASAVVVPVKIRARAPPVVVPKLSVDIVNEMIDENAKRLLKQELIAAQSGATQLRLALLVKILRKVPFHGVVWNEAVMFITQTLSTRLALGLLWLHAEAADAELHAETSQETADARSSSGYWRRYGSLLHELCSGSIHNKSKHQNIHQQENDEESVGNAQLSVVALSSLVTCCPVLTTEVLEFISVMCVDPVMMLSGLQILHDIVVQREAIDRNSALNMLLEFAVCDDAVVRGPVVRLVTEKLYQKEFLRDSIESFSVFSARNACINTSDDEETKTLIEMRMPLLVSLCCDEPLRLIRSFRSVYSFAYHCESARYSVLSHSKFIARKITSQSAALLLLIQDEMTSETETNQELETIHPSALKDRSILDVLVYTMVQSALEGSGKASIPARALVESCVSRYQKSRDVRFLVLIVNGLTKTEFLFHLPALVATPAEIGGGFQYVLNQIYASRNPVLTPAELLVELHQLVPKPSDGLTLEMLIRATQSCFDSTTIYKQDVLAVVLQKVVEETPTPLLFMRTVIQTLRAHPKLQSFVMGILLRLIDKEVWTSPKLWEGFLRCCQITMPRSATVLLRLPPAQLTDALTKCEPLREPLRKYVSQSKNLPGYLLPLIDNR
eukprot:CAMPEP_0182442620 /NCGR_PEP_ID=MMETSP1172-20130603/1533_1 /TAXON_ID=708627 /ORGANISM="Timspurckia oligopyrenoides, Strain CCMP3278" /LENGTH=890 /DNA_ID=CAMNT_0024637587 /DNA_START=764 /DNA_END=3436 /DNA_ORIENTATION=-